MAGEEPRSSTGVVPGGGGGGVGVVGGEGALRVPEVGVEVWVWRAVRAH